MVWAVGDAHGTDCCLSIACDVERDRRHQPCLRDVVMIQSLRRTLDPSNDPLIGRHSQPYGVEEGAYALDHATGMRIQEARESGVPVQHGIQRFVQIENAMDRLTKSDPMSGQGPSVLPEGLHRHNQLGRHWRTVNVYSYGCKVIIC